MIIVSSFTIKMMERGKNLCQSMNRKLEGAKSVIYYENIDNFCFDEAYKTDYPWIEWINLEETDFLGLQQIDQDKHFDHISKKDEFKYLNTHAKFWFRKIAAIRACCLANPDEDTIVWADADCVLRKPLLKNTLEIIKSGEVGYLKRNDKPTDTGIIVFHVKNKAVRDFIFEWYDLYISGKIFELKCWADHCAFDYLKATPKYSNVIFFDLHQCRAASGLIRHCTGHREMVRLRKR